VDKKGILSWPNPAAEKVFFLRQSDGQEETHSLNSEGYDSVRRDSDEHIEKTPLKCPAGKYYIFDFFTSASETRNKVCDAH